MINYTTYGIHQGSSSGSAGRYQITDWKEDIMNKYHNRFTIKTEYDTSTMTFNPIPVVIDNNTNKLYKINHTSGSYNIMNETDRFIQQLIITIRDEKITQVINGH